MDKGEKGEAEGHGKETEGEGKLTLQTHFLDPPPDYEIW